MWWKGQHILLSDHSGPLLLSLQPPVWHIVYTQSVLLRVWITYHRPFSWEGNKRPLKEWEQWIIVGKVWLGLMELIDFFIIIIPAIMVCHAGQLAVIQGPCASLAKCRLNMSSILLGLGDIHLPLSSHLWSWRLNVLLLWCHKATDVLVHAARIISSFTLPTNCTLWSIEFHFPIFPTFLIFCPYFILSLRP